MCIRDSHRGRLRFGCGLGRAFQCDGELVGFIHNAVSVGRLEQGHVRLLQPHVLQGAGAVRAVRLRVRAQHICAQFLGKPGFRHRIHRPVISEHRSRRIGERVPAAARGYAFDHLETEPFVSRCNSVLQGTDGRMPTRPAGSQRLGRRARGNGNGNAMNRLVQRVEHILVAGHRVEYLDDRKVATGRRDELHAFPTRPPHGIPIHLGGRRRHVAAVRESCFEGVSPRIRIACDGG